MLRALGIITVAAFAAEPVSAQVWTPQAAPPGQVVQPTQRSATGWVGITYSGNGETDSDGNLVYSDYPVVVTVDPGSPAAKAGVAAGDTIIAFNDRDLRRFAFPIRNMIQPGKTFVIHARKGRVEREYKVLVVERPADHREMVAITMKPMIPGMPEPPFVLTPGPTPSRVRVPTPARTAAGFAIAGAEMRALSVDLARTLGVKPQGLFVVNVLEASPAKEAGLRDGDVLLRAAERLLMSPQDLQEIMRSDINRSVKLELVRQKKTETVLLRW